MAVAKKVIVADRNRAAQVAPEKGEKTKAERTAEKAAKFSQIASRRVGDLLDAIEKLENLSNRGNYEYSKDQIDRIFEALRVELERVLGTFYYPAEGEEKVKAPRKARFQV